MNLKEYFINEYKKRIIEFYISSILEEAYDPNWLSAMTSRDDDSLSAINQEEDPVMKAALSAKAARPDISVLHSKREEHHSDILSLNKENLAKKGIDISKLKRLNEVIGGGGIAYAIDDKRVLKVTSDSNEAAVSNSLKGKKYSGIVNIYDAWKFPQIKGKNTMYGIIMENLIPFKNMSHPLKEELDEIVDGSNLKQDIIKYNGNMQQIWTNLSASPEFKTLIAQGYNLQNLKQAFDITANLLSSLKNAGITNFTDLHTGNIGMRKGSNEIIVFDIGFAGGGSEPPLLGQEIGDSNTLERQSSIQN